MLVVLSAYTYDWLLSLDSSAQLRLPDIDNQVSALEVSGDSEVEGEVADCLCPFVGKGSLLFLLTSTCRRFGSFIYWCIFYVTVSECRRYRSLWWEV